MTNEIYTLTNLKEYKENQYSIKLKDHLEKYIDFDELHFIEKELYFFENCYHTANVKYWYYGTYLKFGVDELEIKGSRNEIIFKEIQDFKNEYYGFDLEKCERLTLTYSKILDFLNDKRTQLTTLPQQIENSETTTELAPAPANSLNWNGTQTEFIELVKALIDNGSITGTGNQEEKINQLANLLNFKINNPYKLLNDIKTARNNGSETLFLDKLKKTFLHFITLEKKK